MHLFISYESVTKEMKLQIYLFDLKNFKKYFSNEIFIHPFLVLLKSDLQKPHTVNSQLVYQLAII